MNCKIIQDLLPLYCDRVCSEESAQLVEEHLADCGDCTALLAELRKGPAPASPEEAEEDAREQSVFQAVRRRFSLKRRRSVAAAVLGTALLLLVLAAADRPRPMEYREGLLTAALAEDSVLDLYYYGGGYTSVDALCRKEGEENALFLCYDRTVRAQLLGAVESLWSEGASGHLSVGNGLLLDSEKGDVIQVMPMDELDAVYYLSGDYDNLMRLDAPEFQAEAERAVLLWERLP